MVLVRTGSRIISVCIINIRDDCSAVVEVSKDTVLIRGLRYRFIRLGINRVSSTKGLE